MLNTSDYNFFYIFSREILFIQITIMGTELTEEQKKFLEECEEEFADRFTEKDKDFMQVATSN